MLAVSTNDNGIKILANTDGIRLLQRVKCRSTDASRIASAAIIKVILLFFKLVLLMNFLSLSLYINGYLICALMLMKCFILLQPPAMGAFGASNATVEASVVDQAAPVSSTVACVSSFLSTKWNQDTLWSTYIY